MDQLEGARNETEEKTSEQGVVGAAAGVLKEGASRHPHGASQLRH